MLPSEQPCLLLELSPVTHKPFPLCQQCHLQTAPAQAAGWTCFRVSICLTRSLMPCQVNLLVQLLSIPALIPPAPCNPSNPALPWLHIAHHVLACGQKQRPVL
jgi:hypothetical protein